MGIPKSLLPYNFTFQKLSVLNKSTVFVMSVNRQGHIDSDPRHRAEFIALKRNRMRKEVMHQDS